MRIHGKNPEITQPKTTSPIQLTTTSTSPVSGETAAPTRSRNDQVQISDAGRAKAAQASQPTSSLDPQRASDIRRKVLEGAYNSVNVVDTVANRILDRGDV